MWSVAPNGDLVVPCTPTSPGTTRGVRWIGRFSATPVASNYPLPVTNPAENAACSWAPNDSYVLVGGEVYEPDTFPAPRTSTTGRRAAIWKIPKVGDAALVWVDPDPSRVGSTYQVHGLIEDERTPGLFRWKVYRAAGDYYAHLFMGTLG
jgi:hypothetical protein